jgi:hypothetical protein
VDVDAQLINSIPQLLRLRGGICSLAGRETTPTLDHHIDPPRVNTVSLDDHGHDLTWLRRHYG